MSANEWFDDRLFLTSISPATIKRTDEGLIETTIFHDTMPEDPIWVVVYYRNQPRFAIVGTYHFKNRPDADRYRQIVEPTTPLQSLDGKSPQAPLPYSKYLQWKKENGFLDFSPERAYSSPGENRRETIFQTQEQFDEGLRRVHHTLQATP